LSVNGKKLLYILFGKQMVLYSNSKLTACKTQRSGEDMSEGQRRIPDSGGFVMIPTTAEFISKSFCQHETKKTVASVRHAGPAKRP
jgi:hypothetical protein